MVIKKLWENYFRVNIYVLKQSKESMMVKRSIAHSFFISAEFDGKKYNIVDLTQDGNKNMRLHLGLPE